MIESLIGTLVQTTALLAVAALFLALTLDGQGLTVPIDTYQCVRAERSPHILNGCQASTIEKP